MANMTLTAVPYLRVSTTDQVDGFGLDIQLDAIRRWAEDNDVVLLPARSDEGVSGTKPVAERPGLAAALDDLADTDASVLVVHKLDRLARELTTQEVVLATVWRDGHAVHTTAGEVRADDPDDPMRTAMRQMAGVFAQLEAAMIRKRLRDGRRAKRDSGGYAGGAPALGTRANGRGGLATDPAGSAVVASILAQRSAGATWRAITDGLNADGVPAPRGSRWHVTTVRRIADPSARAADAALARARGAATGRASL